MSLTEILEELPKLSREERLVIYYRILELEESMEIEETPEMYAAIEEGLRSLETEPVVSLEEAKKKIAEWAGVKAPRS